MKKHILLLVTLLINGVIMAQVKVASITTNGETETLCSSVCDTVIFSESTKTATTVEAARTLAQNEALGQIMIFTDTAFSNNAPDAKEAEMIEQFEVKIIIHTKKTEQGFTSKTECTAKRRSQSKTQNVHTSNPK